MSWSYIPRWKLTDSCGRPPVPGGIHVGCTHDGHMQQCHATRRALLKAGVAIVGGAGLATVVGPREVFAQIRPIEDNETPSNGRERLYNLAGCP